MEVLSSPRAWEPGLHFTLQVTESKVRMAVLRPRCFSLLSLIITDQTDQSQRLLLLLNVGALPQRLEALDPGVIGHCELPNMGARNQTLEEQNILSPTSHLSSPSSILLEPTLLRHLPTTLPRLLLA